MSGIELIAQERQRQIEQEGWTPEHDDQHNDSEMAMAAVAYIYADEFDADSYRNGSLEILYTAAYSFWPWRSDRWKPKDRLSNLIRAGALIAAEIDRLQRESEVG